MDKIVVDTINEALISRATHGFTRTASWLEVRNGEVGRIKTGPCHSELGNDGGCEYVVNFFQHKYEESHGAGKWSDTTDEEKIMFLDWLANRSPYNDAFFEKDASKMLSWGFCLMTGDVAGNVMGGAVVATRRLWEYTNVLVVWCDLVRSGVEESLAFCLAHHLNGNASREGTYNWLNGGAGHVTLDTYPMTTTTVHNFVTEDAVEYTGKFSKTGNYREYSDMFHGGVVGRNHPPIRNFMTALPLDNGSVDANPFANKRNAYRKPYEQAIKDVVNIIPELKKACDLP